MELREIWLSNLDALIDELAPGEGRGVKRQAYRQIAETAELEEEYVYQLHRRHKRNMSPEAADRIDRAFARGRPFGWFSSLNTSEAQVPLDRPVSQERVTIVQEKPELPAVAWGDMDTLGRLNGRFTVVAPDDAMWDRIRRGQVVEFDKRWMPGPGDAVLVADSAGAWFIRMYGETSEGFEAYPLKSGYRTLYSRDGAKVLGVLSSSGRWGG